MHRFFIVAILLSNFSKIATANEIKEAYCRDIDAFSFDFDIDPQRPPRCDPVPRSVAGNFIEYTYLLT